MYTVRRACTDTDWYEAAALLYDHVEWMRGFTDFDPVAEQPTLVGELDHFADHYASVDAAVFLAHWRAIAVGTVAIHFHHDGDAELKRMYLRPVARGRGIADALIDAAVATAATHGCHTVWLETVRGTMEPAIAVYRRNGFTQTTARQPTLRMVGVVVMERPIATASRCA